MVFIRGRFKADGSFDWRNALVDSAIMAGINFFSTLGGAGAAGLFSDPQKALIIAGISAAGGFLGGLAIKRGLPSTPRTAQAK